MKKKQGKEFRWLYDFNQIFYFEIETKSEDIYLHRIIIEWKTLTKLIALAHWYISIIKSLELQRVLITLMVLRSIFRLFLKNQKFLCLDPHLGWSKMKELSNQVVFATMIHKDIKMVTKDAIYTKAILNTSHKNQFFQLGRNKN